MRQEKKLRWLKMSSSILMMMFVANAVAGTIPAKFVKAYDADTITVNIPDCKYRVFCKRLGVRVAGVDTPELRTKNKCEKKLAIMARNFVRDELSGISEQLSSNTLQLKNVKRGKYFRVVADVKYRGKDLKRELFKRNYGVPYEGKKKMSVDWCLLLRNR